MLFEQELHRLANFDVKGWNESEVREMLLAPLLRLLGYEKNSSYDQNHEKHLLAHPFLMVGRGKVKIDYALVVRRRNFWILEAKRPGKAITAEAIHQACFYAIHPEVQARFFAVCDGASFQMFDVYTVDESYSPVLSFTLRELPLHFAALRERLGAHNVRTTLTERVLRDLEAVALTALREEQLDILKAKTAQVIEVARPQVRENARSVWRQEEARQDRAIAEMFPHNSANQIARVAFAHFDTPQAFELVFRVFCDKLRAQRSTFDANVREVASLLESGLSSTHRAHIIEALLRLMPRRSSWRNRAARARVSARRVEKIPER